MSYAISQYGVIEPIVRYVWVSSKRNVQSKENHGLDYAVKGVGDVKRMQAIIFTLNNRSAN